MTQVTDYTRDTPCGALIFSDFRHGIFNHQTIPELTAAIPPGTFRVADSQVASRWGNILEFKDFDLITPNEKEARFSLGDQDSVIRPLALKLYQQARCKNLILKLGARGMITYRAVESPEKNVRAFFAVDSLTNRAVDPVGAGDALVAYATLALASGNGPVVGSILGAMAAALECEIDGNRPVPTQSILDRLDEFEKRVNFQ